MRGLGMLVLVGCTVPPEAPEDLDALSHYLYREWSHPSDAVLADGLRNLATYFEGVDLSPDRPVLERSWELTSLTEADLADVDGPEGTDPSETYSVGVARQSVWAVQDHAAWQLQTDQRPAEPTAVGYVRAFGEMEDPSCFLDASCEVLLTVNEIERSNALMSVSYTYFKNMRWVELEGELAMVSRAWLAESAVGDAGKSTIWQSYSMDVWLPAEEGSWRYQVLWSESDVAGASDALQVGVVKGSTENHFKATDEAIFDVQ